MEPGAVGVYGREEVEMGWAWGPPLSLLPVSGRPAPRAELWDSVAEGIVLAQRCRRRTEGVPERGVP